MDITFIVDTTQSMQPWIDRVKKTIEKMYTEILHSCPDTLINIIGYKDICDRKCSLHNNNCPITCEDNKWIQVSGYTKNTDYLLSFLHNIHASGGGDIPEDLFGALQVGIKQDFRESSKKIFLIITDAPPHGKMFTDYSSDTPTYPLPYQGAKKPVDILQEIQENNISVYFLDIQKTILDKTYQYFLENNINTYISYIYNSYWKFSYIIPDTMIGISKDIPVYDYIDGFEGPFSSLFFQIHRNMDIDTLQKHIENCYNNGIHNTVRMIMCIRNREGSIQEKNIGRQAYWILRNIDKTLASKYYNEYITKYGCLQDLLHIAKEADKTEGCINHIELKYIAIVAMKSYIDCINTKKGKKIIRNLPKNRRERHKRLQKCLHKDILDHITDDSYIRIHPSLIAKWLPKFHKSLKGFRKVKKYWESKHSFATRIAKLLFVYKNTSEIKEIIKGLPSYLPCNEIIEYLPENEKTHPELESFYRELYRFLAVYGENEPVEVKMCSNEWDDIEYKKITSGAQNKYKKCFSKRIPDKVQEAIQHKHIKSNTLDGHKIISYFIEKILSKYSKEVFVSDIESSLVEEQWKEYKKHKSYISNNCNFQIDCSGSMLEGDIMPLSIALQLFLLSENKTFIPFFNPRECIISGDSLEKNIESILSYGMESSGDIVKGIEISLQQKKDTHIVFTDGKYPLLHINKIIDLQNEYKQNIKVIIFIIQPNNTIPKVKKIQDIDNLYIVTGYSPLLLEFLIQSKNSIESEVISMLRKDYILE